MYAQFNKVFWIIHEKELCKNMDQTCEMKRYKHKQEKGLGH